MAAMTEAEAWVLEDEVTRNPPKVSGAGRGGFFARHKDAAIIFVDNISAGAGSGAASSLAVGRLVATGQPAG